MRLTKPKIALFAALLFLSLALVLPPTREGAKLLVNDLFALSESANAYVYERLSVAPNASRLPACILLGVGALASLEHLSDPTVSFYTITNVGTSWLSREILFVGLFGAGLLLWLITLNAWARRLAAILGLAFVYVMSRVYTIPTVPFWNSLFTYWLFLATSLLLGSSLLLFMDALAARKDPEKKAALLLGWYPVFIVLAFILQMLVIPLQLLLAQSPFSTYLLAWHLTLLLFGAALGPLLLIRNGVNEMLPGACRTCPCPLWIRAGIILLLIVAGEVCGRALFYSGYTWFGM